MPRPTSSPSSPSSIEASGRRPLAALLLLAWTCGSTPDDGPRTLGPPPPPRPWTQAFLHPAVLVANEVTIEGPEDLLEHFASRQEPGAVSYSTRTTENGLLQEFEIVPGVGAEIRAQLDALEIVALRRLVVLQRPGEVPVTVRARGQAFWSRSDGSEERREDSLVLRGVRGSGPGR